MVASVACVGGQVWGGDSEIVNTFLEPRILHLIRGCIVLSYLRAACGFVSHLGRKPSVFWEVYESPSCEMRRGCFLLTWQRALTGKRDAITAADVNAASIKCLINETCALARLSSLACKDNVKKM